MCVKILQNWQVLHYIQVFLDADKFFNMSLVLFLTEISMVIECIVTENPLITDAYIKKNVVTNSSWFTVTKLSKKKYDC